MTDDPAPAGEPFPAPGGISELAAQGLRLGTGMDLGSLTRMTLDAVVPGFADAAVVLGAENLLRGGDPAGTRTAGGPGHGPGHGPGSGSLPGQETVRRLGIRFTGGQEEPGAFPPGEVVVLAAGSPYARCMSDGEAALFTRPGSRAVEHLGPRGRKALSRYVSFLAVPMKSGAAVTGIIALARAPGRPPFGDGDIAGITYLASCAGAGITGVVTMARHRSVAGALQRGLQAAAPSRPEHLEVAGRSLPAAGHLVGGDWYDVIPLPAGRTGLVIGDVMGHGPEAAAAMAQLRAAAHALAQLDLEPAELLGQLDRLIMTLHGAPLATCVYAVIDPGGRSCTVAAAGHLPPVLAFADGRTRLLDMPAGQSLGIGPAAYGQARIKLPAGAVLALYTDGLVETRSRSFGQGISVLRAELARGQEPLAARCDALIDALARHPDDDITLVLVRIPPGPLAP